MGLKKNLDSWLVSRIPTSRQMPINSTTIGGSHCRWSTSLKNTSNPKESSAQRSISTVTSAVSRVRRLKRLRCSRRTFS